MQRLFGDFQQLLQKLDAVDLTGLEAVFQRIESFRQLLELGVAAVPAQPALELDLDLLGLLRVGIREHGLQQIGVQHQGVEVIPHGVDVDVLVDQLDGLGPQRMPDQLAMTAGRLH